MKGKYGIVSPGSAPIIERGHELIHDNKFMTYMEDIKDRLVVTNKPSKLAGDLETQTRRDQASNHFRLDTTV
jgi:hypothetical protein